MSSFTGEFRLESVWPERFYKGRRLFRTCRAITYFVGDKDSGFRVDVPEGFITDGASTPGPIQALFAPVGEHAAQAVIHDMLNREAKVPRFLADYVLFESLGVARDIVPAMSLHRRLAIFAGVRAGGWRAYGRELYL